MARICKTLPANRKHFHREHRSKRGRTKIKPKEHFDPQILAPKLKRIEKLLDADFLGIVREAEGKVPIKKPKGFPRFRCECCGQLFKMTFNPLLGGELYELKCPLCRHWAYFTEYYDFKDIYDFYHTCSLGRDLIHEKKLLITDIL